MKGWTCWFAMLGAALLSTSLSAMSTPSLTAMAAVLPAQDDELAASEEEAASDAEPVDEAEPLDDAESTDEAEAVDDAEQADESEAPANDSSPTPELTPIQAQAPAPAAPSDRSAAACTDSADCDSTIYQVVVNHEEQYSVWPASRELPGGWTAAGKSGSKAECLAYIEEVWADQRPASLRKKMEEAARSAQPDGR